MPDFSCVDRRRDRTERNRAKRSVVFLGAAVSLLQRWGREAGGGWLVEWLAGIELDGSSPGNRIFHLILSRANTSSLPFSCPSAWPCLSACSLVRSATTHSLLFFHIRSAPRRVVTPTYTTLTTHTPSPTPFLTRFYTLHVPEDATKDLSFLIDTALQMLR